MLLLSVYADSAPFVKRLNRGKRRQRRSLDDFGKSQSEMVLFVKLNTDCACGCPIDWQGVKFRVKRPTIKITFRAIAPDFPITSSTQKLLLSKPFVVSTSKSLAHKSFS